MPFDFPNSPTIGQKYMYGNITYIWNGYGWVAEPIPDFVNVEGDTMTGPLTIRQSGTLGHLFLDNPVVTDVVPIVFKKNNIYRWSINATAGPEPGAEVGTNFSVRRYNDAGTVFGDVPLNINRKTGRAQVGQAPVDPFDIATKAYVDSIVGGGPGYLPLTGGSLSGALHAPTYFLDAPAGGQADFWARVNGAARWLQRMTDNYELHRYDNAGGYLGSPFQIARATGHANFAHNLNVAGQIVGGSVWSTTGYLGTFSSDNATITNCTSYGTFNLTAVSCNTLTANAITDYGAFTAYGQGWFNSNLTVVGTQNIHGGALTIYSPSFHTYIDFMRSDGGLGTRLLEADLAPHILPGGVWEVRRNTTEILGLTVYGSGATWSSYGYNAKPGIYGGPRSNCWNFDWGNGLWAWIDNTSLGMVAFQSDYRIKRNVENLPSMWAKVRSLRPIKYNFADYTPPDPREYGVKDYDGSEIDECRAVCAVKPTNEAAPLSKASKERMVAMAAERVAAMSEEERGLPDEPPEPEGPMFAGDEIEHWGFIAHEVQESLVMDAATGVKDQWDIVQSLNPWTTIAAVTRALQEAMERIEQLEMRLGIQR